MKSLLKTVFLAAVSLGWFVSCGLPSYDVLDAPVRVDSDGKDMSLSFKTVDGVNFYILAYKIYWSNSNETTLLSSDKSSIADTDTVSTGFTTLKSLGYIQMRDSTGSQTNYPSDSTDITIEQDIANTTIELTFDESAGDLSVTGANNTSVLYRRVKKVDSSGSVSDSSVIGKSFLTKEYDYHDEASYEVSSVTISGDSTDGIDSDFYPLFKASRFDGSNYDLSPIYIGVAAYSYSVSANAVAIESIPVFLGYVEITADYWNGG